MVYNPTLLRSQFAYTPATEDYDAEYRLKLDPTLYVQVARGVYMVNEAAPEGTPEDDYWMRGIQWYTNLNEALERCQLEFYAKELKCDFC